MALQPFSEEKQIKDLGDPAVAKANAKRPKGPKKNMKPKGKVGADALSQFLNMGADR